MHNQVYGRTAALTTATWLLVFLSGCTSWKEYVHNGFKVGPDYCRPAAPVADHWIDEADVRIRSESEDLSNWWLVFNDPVLTSLIHEAYEQNLSLREAGFRVLMARYQLAITTGALFPQQQDAFGSFQRSQRAASSFGSSGPLLGGSNRFFDQWSLGFNLAWELDFWGRYRRAVLASEAQLDASIEDYDDVLVTLLGDIATYYVQMRVFEEQTVLAKENVQLQQDALDAAQAKLDAGLTSDLDRDQAQSNLAQTQAQIPLLEIGQRQAANRICVLLGIPPVALQDRVGRGPIPAAPADVAVGIPAQLLSRRPDVRRAERDAAAQAQQIGIAESDLYPAILINGTLGFQATQFSNLFSSRAFNGSIGPSFQWNLLNYGRLTNNVRLQDAAFQQLATTYQQTVLLASEEVENGLISFLRSQQRVESLQQSVTAAKAAADTVVRQYDEGAADFNRVAIIQQDLVTRQDLLAQAKGQIALGLIQVYRALGGGWEIRLQAANPPETLEPARVPSPTEAMPPAEPFLPAPPS